MIEYRQLQNHGCFVCNKLEMVKLIDSLNCKNNSIKYEKRENSGIDQIIAALNKKDANLFSVYAYKFWNSFS